MNSANKKIQSPLHCVTPLHLEESPSMALLLAKALFKTGNFKLGDSLPPLTAHWENLSIDSSHLQRYNQICGFDYSHIIGEMNIGFPVVDDEQHGAEGNPIGRIALHASAVEFLHPETDDPVRFDATIPFGPE